MAGEASKQIDQKTLWGGGKSPFSISYGKMMMWYFLVSDALTFSGLLVAYGFIRHQYGAWPTGEEIFQALPFMGDGYPLIYVALMTFILIVSSVTMVLAVEAGHRMYKPGVIKWLLWTVVGGLFFLGSQVWEWSHFIHGSDGGAVQIAETGDWARAYGSGGHGEPFVFESLTMIESGVEYTGAEAQLMYENRTDEIHGANLVENEYAPEIAQYANFFFFITGFHGFHVFSGVLINFIVLIQCVNGVYERRGHYEMVEKAGLYWHFIDLVWVFVFTFFYLV